MNELLEPLRHALQTMLYPVLLLITLATCALWLYVLKLLRNFEKEAREREAYYERLVAKLDDEGGCAPLSAEQREHLKQIMP